MIDIVLFIILKQYYTQIEYFLIVNINFKFYKYMISKVNLCKIMITYILFSIISNKLI